MRRIMKVKQWFSGADHRSESGQALILIGFAAIVLIAIAGLAIDGGRLFFLKRETQNASDAAAIAAARALCEGRADFIVAGEAAASANGFVDGDGSDTVEIISPPEHASIDIPDECAGCYVEVTVGGEIPASFIGVVYDGPLSTTSHAIAACNPNQYNASETEGSSLRALFGLSESCEVSINGASFTVVGGAHANGLLDFNGSAAHPSDIYGPVSYSGSLGSQMYKGTTYCPPDCEEGYDYGGGGGGYSTPAGLCASTCFDSGSSSDDGGGGGGGGCTPGDYPSENPYAECDSLPDPLAYEVSDFAPGSAFALAAAADPDGGYYDYTKSGGACNKNGTKAWINGKISGGVLPTGLYYFGNCEIQLQSFNNVSGTITWVSGDSIKISGGTNNLHAYTDDLLFFSDAGGDSCTARGVELPGSSNTLYGNVYAPHGEIKFSASDSTVYGCLVGYQVGVPGSSATIVCDSDSGSTTGDPGIWMTE